MNKTFFVAGGDLRQIYAAEKLAKNFSVYVTGFDRNIIIPENINIIDTTSSMPERADYLLLPMSVSTDGITLNAPYCKSSIPISQLTSTIKENGIVFGGKIEYDIKNIFTASNLEVSDYLNREEFSVLNAIPTAEGAIQIAFEELATTIYGSEVLVMGFGRISKILIKNLNSLGANVTVTARKYSDLAWAEINGCKTIHISNLDKSVNSFNIIFNTIPCVILNDIILKRIRKDCLVIDLASKPGGVDFKAASELGVKVVWALGLPGKVAPISAGRIIADTVMNILSERGLTYE